MDTAARSFVVDEIREENGGSAYRSKSTNGYWQTWRTLRLSLSDETNQRSRSLRWWSDWKGSGRESSRE